MKILNESQKYMIFKFLQRYDYDAARDILKEAKIEDGDLYLIMESCKYAINFDFKKSLNLISELSGEIRQKSDIQKLISNLKHMIDGDVDDIFSELIENMKIQIVNEEYIDFLGRLYRLYEALFKYIFVSSKIKDVSMHSHMVSKKNILYTLKTKYNIYNANLIHGVTQYINKYVNKSENIESAMEILLQEKLEKLLRLRNDSPVGHGFKGVSKEDIEQMYDDPLKVIDDMVKACELMGININLNKYDKINKISMQLIEKYIN